MKVPKKVVHVICGIFEAAFAALIALEAYYVAESIRRTSLAGGIYTTASLCSFAVDIILPALLLAATITIHILAIKPACNAEQIEAKHKERKQKRIERLESELETLRKDGD